jgi:hypothetical protein
MFNPFSLTFKMSTAILRAADQGHSVHTHPPDWYQVPTRRCGVRVKLGLRPTSGGCLVPGIYRRMGVLPSAWTVSITLDDSGSISILRAFSAPMRHMPTRITELVQVLPHPGYFPIRVPARFASVHP